MILLLGVCMLILLFKYVPMWEDIFTTRVFGFSAADEETIGSDTLSGCLHDQTNVAAKDQLIAAIVSSSIQERNLVSAGGCLDTPVGTVMLSTPPSRLLVHVCPVPLKVWRLVLPPLLVLRFLTVIIRTEPLSQN